MIKLYTRTTAIALCLILAAACSDPDGDNNANNGADAGGDVQTDTAPDSDASEDDLTVASVQPASGPTTGGTQVVISGTGFEEIDSVTFDGTAAPVATRVSSFEMEVETPTVQQTGLVDVTVTLAGGESATLTDGFEYTEAGPELSIGYCVLQFPETATTTPNTETAEIYGRVFVENCSEGDAQCDAVTGQLGWGPPAANPTTNTDDFTWETTSYNPDHTSDNNDEYTGTITPEQTGEYAYIYRFRVDDGAWTYCDLDGSDNGLAAEQTGTLTVEESTEPQVGSCTIQFPDSTSTAPGAPSELIYGRAFVQGCTNGDAECADLQGEVGVGDPTVDPSSSPADYDWTAASYNPDHTADDNDEYQASVEVADAGNYSYAYRFRVGDDGTWAYCDLDGSENGFSTDQMGALNVESVDIGWCNTQFPGSIDATVGDDTTVYGQAYVENCTDGGNDCGPLIAQLGVAADGSDASTDASAYNWIDASLNSGFSGDANDEFQAVLPATDQGSFVYAYRMSGDGGQTWTYCDTDGTDNGFQADQQGTMTVSSP